MTLARVGKLHIGLVGGAAGFAVVGGLGDAASVVLGGAVMGVNLWLMRIIAGAMMQGSGVSASGHRAGLAVVAIVLKFGLFLGLVAALFTRLPIEGMSFAVGVTLLLAACVVEGVRGAVAQVKGES